MKKRLFSMLLSFCLMLTLIPLVTARAAVEDPEPELTPDSEPMAQATMIVDSGECGADGDNLTWTLDDAGTLTISGTGPMINYTGSNDVPWYSVRDSIKTVQIASDVTSIGEWAFQGCRRLTHVIIPSSVTLIGIAAFSDCSGLTSAGPIGSGCDYEFGWTDTIPAYAFWRCSGLTHVTIPSSVAYIGSSAFSDCTEITSAGPIGSGCDYEFGWTDTIPAHAFNGCSGLMHVTIPSSATSIEDYAFSNCRKLTRVTIPSSVTSIGDSAFSNCSGLMHVTIPNLVTYIGNSAFFNCSGLMHVTIPNSVTSIGWSTFWGCSGLTSAGPIGSGCDYEFGWADTIPEYAFNGCSGLTSITIPGSITSIGRSAFSNCRRLTSITIPSSVTSIGGSAFYDCSGLTCVTIPGSVTSIEWSAFYGCRNLKDVYYNGTKGQWNTVTVGINNEPLTSATMHYEKGIPDLNPVIDTPEVLKDAFTVSGSGTVTMTIPVGLPAVKNVLCAFDDNVEYQAGSIHENDGKRQVVFEPKEDINYKTAKIFTLDKDYRPVCESTIVKIPTSN